ncbi:antitoxin Xre/MbcA/ParS toxin-binding domain-containing protein [Noviherbaspirillum pedocola]|uniref:DUF2384 domain-containing protein n=1 Tax=Noviherbaspirillum pedocola TaxID=2801341 RepID=A0A934T0G3_9BURK|nr:antitoxin Xre/MbcA/ParS toxin-binding domain-containing protein [Noviherbaspirillum pedocola]MBK4739162.1 DUF2384 domain-containing protein [Noviherbaspirillum pedocola]
MEDDFAATGYGSDIENLLLLVSVKLQKVRGGSGIEAETWLSNWLDTPNPAFNGVCPRVVLQTSQADPKRFQAKQDV